MQMFLWLAFAALTAAVAAALLTPFNRRFAVTSRHTTSATLVYRDQLLEVDRDLASASIGVIEADYAKAEIARHLICATKPENGATGMSHASPTWLKWSIVVTAGEANVRVTRFSVTEVPFTLRSLMSVTESPSWSGAPLSFTIMLLLRSLCVQFVSKIGQFHGILPVQADNGPTANFGGMGRCLVRTA